MGIASELIERGWIQGQLTDSTGAVCLDGAVCASVDILDHDKRHRQVLFRDYAKASEAVNQALSELYPDVRGGYVWFNDHLATFDDVLRVAKRADEILDGQ